MTQSNIVQERKYHVIATLVDSWMDELRASQYDETDAVDKTLMHSLQIMHEMTLTIANSYEDAKNQND